MDVYAEQHIALEPLCVYADFIEGSLRDSIWVEEKSSLGFERHECQVTLVTGISSNQYSHSPRLHRIGSRIRVSQQRNLTILFVFWKLKTQSSGVRAIS